METLRKQHILERHNTVIATFMGVELKPIDDHAVRDSVFYTGKWYRNFGAIPFDSDWNLIIPVWKKCAEIGLWMMTNNHDKLWLIKSKEIECTILHEGNVEKTMIYIARLIEWYNEHRN